MTASSFALGRFGLRNLALALFPFLLATGAQASVEISTKPTKNMSCSSGVCMPTAKKAFLNVNDVTSMLGAGDLTVKTGNGAVTITMSAPFAWASTHRLTLDANVTVSFRAAVTVEGTGAVTIVTNDGGTGGDLIFFDGGTLDFWDLDSNLVINGQTYLLVRDLASLSKLIASNASSAYAMTRHFKGGSYTQAPIDALPSGIVEGLGHTINKLNISQTRKRPCVGLFGTIAAGAIVRDVRVTHANVVSTVSGRHIGALAGCTGGAIANAGSDGLVQGFRSSDIGGLVGNNAGIISNSVSSAQTVGTDDPASHGHGLEHTGGLVGFNTGNITGSSAAGDVSSGVGSFVGGLVGWSNSGTISKSHASGAVTNEGACCGGSSSTGGLVGALGPVGNVDQSYATGTVHGGFGQLVEATDQIAIAAGLVGEGSNITNSYALGSVTADNDSNAGGLVGDGDAISNSYSVGSVGAEREGGFVADDTGNGPLSMDYWDLDTSGISNPDQGAGNIPDDPGITGLTDAQLKSGLPAGFDPAIWGQSPSINNGYPYLLANPPPQ